MRRIFSDYIEQISTDEKVIFITGDLGYNALENLQQKMQHRFINAGVAEQNMIGVAAGLASKGFKVFVYSIAPFTTYRCLEQIRVDVGFHNLPVFIVGNGGGYGYGIMGATHHAIEDIACMSSMPNMSCYVPAFAQDVTVCIDEIIAGNSPAYLRLGLGLNYPHPTIQLNGMNQILDSENAQVSVVALGPVANNILDAVKVNSLNSKIDLFTAIKLPFENLPVEFLNSVSKTKKLIVVEEHIERGGLAEHILIKLMNEKIIVNDFFSIHALGYPDKTYGSQSFHQKQSGLDAENIGRVILNLINNR